MHVEPPVMVVPFQLPATPPSGTGLQPWPATATRGVHDPQIADASRLNNMSMGVPSAFANEYHHRPSPGLLADVA
jgi:hypothetical protein